MDLQQNSRQPPGSGPAFGSVSFSLVGPVSLRLGIEQMASKQNFRQPANRDAVVSQVFIDREIKSKQGD